MVPLVPQVPMPKTVSVAAPTPVLGRSVTGITPVQPHLTPKPKQPARYSPSHDTWPAASSGKVALTGSVAASTAPLAHAVGTASPGAMAAGSSQHSNAMVSAGRVNVAGTPVWVSVPAGKPVSQSPSSVAVSVAAHQAAVAAGIDGVVFSVSAGSGSGATQVGLNYASFDQAYGGDYGQRLQLVELPGCALTTPKVAACRTQTRLSSANDLATQTVSAQVFLAAPKTADAAASSAGSAKAAPLVLAALSSPSGGDGGGSAGQSGATSLKPSGTWSAGGTSGSFTYSYPIAVPPAASALAPQVNLSYDSGSIDGQTAASQSQANWLGDGWSTPENFIEQSFVSCADDPEGTAAPNPTQDLCYDGPILSLSLNGSVIQLVCNQAETSCTPSDAGGDVVVHHTGSNNGSGTYNTDYWTVTDTSGTVYSFGLNKLPGFSGADATTNSVASEPVYSAHSGDPCFSQSVCTMAYRWNLDYVKDLYGNAMAYYYTQATNAYAENGNTSGAAVSYIRDTYLKRIDYGFRDGGAYGTVANQIVFTPGDRCTLGASKCDPLSSSTAANWPDVPYDLNCAAGSACAVTSPSIWSTVSLASITTQQWNGTTYAAIDQYTFTQTIPSVTDGTAPTLFLSSITRKGEDTGAGGAAVALQPVTFSPVMLPNRAYIQDGLPALDRYRIGQITTETGSVIGVSYEVTNPCSNPVTVTPSNNSTSCYPVYWTPSGGTQILDWFNKYAVASVTQSDPYGGSGGLYTAYKYADTPAWHYDDNELVQPKYRTYGQFRGYGDVKTFTGTAPDAQTESETWYYRGMSDDNDTTAVTLIDSQNGQHDDTNALAGQTLETAQYFYASTSTTPPVASSTIDAYWISPVIASRTRTGLPALIAQRVEPDETWTRSAITDASPSTWSETAQVTTYDATTTDASFGLPLYQYATGDLALVGTAHSQETCNETTYTAPNTNLNLVALVAETRSVDEACGGTSAIGSSTPTAPTGSQINGLTAPSSVNLATDVIEDTRTFYDNPTMASTWPQPSSPTWPQSAPNTPQVSVTQAANGYDSTSGQLTYITKAASLYDSYNRPVTDYDAMGDESQFAYTMTSYGTVTATTTTNALGQAQSTTLDPARALVLTVTDANGVTTTTNYDGLGRSIAVWDDGRATSSTANALYTYAISNNAAPTVTTETLDDESFPVKSVEIYDSLLRPRESQTQAVSTTAGRIITDTIYDTHGWVVKQNTNYYDSSTNPDTTLGSVPDNKVADQTVTAYDGLGRAVEVQHLNNTATPVVDDISYTQYTGDKTTNVPPTGGVAQTTVTDALGRTTELDQYSESPTVTTGTSGGFTTATVTGGTTLATTYGYNTHGLQASITDANNDMWSTTYDFLGQVYTSTDPDAGTTTTLYDAQGRVSQTTDNAGNILSYSYDALGRKIAEYNAAATNQQPYVSAASPGNEVASWIYDNRNSVAGVTHAIGQLTAQNAYTSAGVFTTQAINFNVFGESLGESYTIPNTNVNTATLAGTYTYKHSYTTTTGLPKQTSIPAAGGMASEITTTGYSQYDGVDVVTALNGVNSDLANVNYTQWGQIAELQLGNASVTSPNALVDYTYDQLTGAPLTSSVTNTAVSGTAMDKTGYTYDASGNPTSATETRSGTATETQCYTYDPLDRLTNAWTAAGSCAALPTSANETTTIGDQISGGAYWTSWTFDNIGQFKTQTQHSPTGGTDTTTTDFYGTNTTGNCSGQAGGGAHTLNATTTIGPSGTQGAIYCSNSIGQTTSMPSSTGQNSLNWNPEGQLQQVTTAAGASTYLYDAAGNLVERTDPGTVTVYLPGQQIAFNSSTQTTTTTRSIALPGGTQVVETGNTGNYRYEVANAQGTATISLDSTLQHPTYQQYTPYGAPRGTTPAPWTDPNGYLGKVQDPADNLVTMGARQYAPTLGRFVSLDPVLEATDPQQLNGYTYAGANPITGSDPTGTTKCDADPELCPGSGGSTTSTTTNNGSGNTGSTGGSTGSTGGSTGSSTPMQCSGLHGKLAALCEGGTTDQQVCDATCLQIQQFSAACSAKGGQDENGTCTFPPPPKPHHWWETALLVVAAVIIVAVVIAVIVNPLLLVPALVAAGESFGTATAGGATLGLGVFAGAAAAGATVATAAGATALGVGLGVAAVLAGGSYEGSGGESCESFTASTQVVMADGKKKAIDAVKPGDKIQAKNTNTLKSETQTVEAVNVNHDTDIYDLIIHTKHGNAVIHATANHPIWDETTRSWVVAEELHRGDQLLTNDGSQATFLGGITPKITTGWMWDLSVSSDHDFYVVAGSTPVLVHNCAPEFVSNAQAGLAGKRVTTGRIFDADGNPLGVEDKVHELTAGSDGLSPQTSAYLHEAAGNGNLEPINPRFRYPQDTHVESKYATWMRNNSVTDADVVINHPNGICSNALNCADAIPAILPQNSVMRVWAPGATEPVEFWGTA